MIPTPRMRAALAVLAVALIGCSQPSGNPTGGAEQAMTPASTTPASTTPASTTPASTTPASTTTPAPSVEPSVAATDVDAAVIPQPPVEFTGRIVCGPPVRSDSTENLDVGDEAMALNRYRGGAWRQTVTMTDPRLQGTVYQTWESDEYRLAGAEEGPGVWAATRRIENEQGAWVTLGIGGTFVDGTDIGNTSLVYVGEGAYEGLVAIMEEIPDDDWCASEVRGVIFDGAPVPQPYISR